LESRWRYNVWWTGWTLGPFTLAARFVGNPLAAITNWELSTGVRAVIIRSLSDANDWLFVGPLGELSPSFPYGYSVEPDSS